MIERRSFEAAQAAETITVRIPFNSPSRDLGGFTEVIAPQAFKRSLVQDHEVIALWSHDPSKPLAKRSNGTLELAADESALTTRFKPDATTWSEDARASVTAGTVTGASFGFDVLEDVFQRVNGSWRRTLLDVDLIEISPTVAGAYPAASATAA